MHVFRIVLACLVSAIWTAGYILAYVNGTDQPGALNALMAIVLGWVFGSTVVDTVKRARRSLVEPERQEEPDA